MNDVHVEQVCRSQLTLAASNLDVNLCCSLSRSICNAKHAFVLYFDKKLGYREQNARQLKMIVAEPSYWDPRDDP